MIHRDEILRNVLDTAWAYSPEKFLKSVLARTGQSFEGEVSFGYYEQYPEELAEGVTLNFLGDELVLKEDELDRYVVEYASERLRALPNPALAALVKKITAPRLRI